MARKSRGRGGGGGRGRGRRTTGIEKYGQDEEDEFLALDEQSGEEAEHEDEDDEDVMALKPLDDGESYVKPKKTKGAKGAKASDEESEVDLEPVSKGWGRHDFYGGEDAGDDSEGASDEDRTFKEAKKLEELRALRLQDLSDPLAALLGDGADVTTKGTEESGATSQKSVAEVDAQFESMFTEEAEKSQVNRDLSQLSDAKRKSLLKKEAPELLPLLQDFQSKLEMLLPLSPLLKPGALSELPASGAAYATARISLLLNHLANLSFYLLMKAEGGDVRSHPVVSQLVWLRELEEHLQPLNKRLHKKMQKAAREAKKRSKVSTKPRVPKPAPVTPEAVAKTKTPLTLAERLEKLRGKVQKKDEAEPQQKRLPALDSAISTSLLKLPGKRKAKLGSGDGPADLDEIDPTLGAWLPSSTLSQQLSEVQQHLRERKAKDVPQASDKNPDARERQHREKLRLEVDPREADQGGEDTNPVPASSDEDEMIKEAKAKAKAKKEQKAAALSAKDKAKVARQYHPEVKLEGRRGTSKQILENRGLVRHRKRKAGNARVSNRQKYDKLVKRRKGAVQEMREAAPDGATYDGEATGVRTHLRKSLKLN